MIESSLAFKADTTKTADAGYTQWQGAMAATRARQQNNMRYDINDRTAGPMPTFGSMVDKSSMFTNDLGNAYAPTPATPSKPDITYEPANKDDQLSFGDIIDIINPLQHLPVIGTLYRKFTGDTMKGFSEIIGGAIYGGPVGAVSSTLDVAVKECTGKDMAENALSLVGIDVSPAKAASTSLTYSSAPLPQTAATADLAGTTLAVANLSLARDGRHSFAAKSATTSSYNS